MTMLDKIGLKDFMKSRFALGLFVLTSVAATALTITQASASSTQLKEGEWISDTITQASAWSAQLKEGEWISDVEISGEKYTSTSTSCYDREMLSNFLAGLAYAADKNEVVIHSSTQFEVSSKFHSTSGPDGVSSIHYNFKYNGPCKKDYKTGDVSIKDESGEQGTIEFNANEAMDDYRARAAEDALKARSAE